MPTISAAKGRAQLVHQEGQEAQARMSTDEQRQCLERGARRSGHEHLSVAMVCHVDSWTAKSFFLTLRTLAAVRSALRGVALEQALVPGS